MITRKEIEVFEEYTRRKLKEENVWTNTNLQRWREIWQPFNEVEKIWWAQIPPLQVVNRNGQTFIAKKTSSPGWYEIDGYNTEGANCIFTCRWS